MAIDNSYREQVWRILRDHVTSGSAQISALGPRPLPDEDGIYVTFADGTRAVLTLLPPDPSAERPIFPKPEKEPASDR